MEPRRVRFQPAPATSTRSPYPFGKEATGCWMTMTTLNSHRSFPARHDLLAMATGRRSGTRRGCSARSFGSCVLRGGRKIGGRSRNTRSARPLPPTLWHSQGLKLISQSHDKESQSLGRLCADQLGRSKLAQPSSTPLFACTLTQSLVWTWKVSSADPTAMFL